MTRRPNGVMVTADLVTWPGSVFVEKFAQRSGLDPDQVRRVIAGMAGEAGWQREYLVAGQDVLDDDQRTLQRLASLAPEVSQ